MRCSFRSLALSSPRAALALLLLGGGTALAQPTLTTLTPARNQSAAPRAAAVQLTFTEAITAASAPNLRLFSHQRGGQLIRTGQGPLTGGGTSTLTFTPSKPFRPGETLYLTVPPTLLGPAGLAAVPLVAQFTAATGGSGQGRLEIPDQGAEVTVENGPFGLTTGDLDGDGDLDLVTANYGGGPGSTVSLRLNDGTGQFLTPPNGTLTVSTGPTAVVTADVDNDGDLDFLVACASANTVSLRLNDGNADFTAPLTGAEIRVGTTPQYLALADIDADGDLDLLAVNYTDSTVSVRLNDGTGLFTPPATGAEVAVGNGPGYLALADLDGDGDLDLLTANYTASTVSRRLNDGTGQFRLPAGGAEIAVGAGPSRLVVADIDGDGDLDALTSDLTNNTVTVLLNDGAGTLAAPTIGAFLAVPPSPTSLAVGDMDADGDLDLLTCHASTDSVWMLLNDGRGRFAPPTSAGGSHVGRIPFAVALADVDGDGDLDVLTANFRNAIGGSVSVRLNAAFSPTGVAETAIGTNRLTLFPNPATSREICATGLTTRHPVEVFDAIGRRVLHLAATGTATLRLASLPAGIYTVRNGAQTRRLALE